MHPLSTQLSSSTPANQDAVDIPLVHFFTVACASDGDHSPADRWPESVDVSNLARYARAFANGVLELARQTAAT